jgi:hypothetical protein
VLLHPFEFLAAAVDGTGSHQDGDIRGVGAFEEGLEFGDEDFGTVGASGGGVGEEIGVLEPDGLAVAEEREGLNGGAKAGDDSFEFAEILDGALDDLAGEFVGEAGGHFREALATTPGDEEIVVAADKSKGAEGGGHGRVSKVKGKRRREKGKRRGTCNRGVSRSRETKLFNGGKASKMAPCLLRLRPWISSISRPC